MVTKQRCILVGMGEITKYSNLSEDVVLYLIHKAAFPAKKTRVDSGTWISNTDAIDEWSRIFCCSGASI